MSMKYDLVVSEQYKKGEETKNAYTRVGQAWALDSGKGFSFVVRKNLTVSGSLALIPSTPKNGDRPAVPEADLVRHQVVVSEEGKSKEGEDAKTYYTTVGMMFPLESKKGFSIKIREHVAVSNGFAAFKPSPTDQTTDSGSTEPDYGDFDDDIPF